MLAYVTHSSWPNNQSSPPLCIIMDRVFAFFNSFKSHRAVIQPYTLAESDNVNLMSHSATRPQLGLAQGVIT